MKAKIVVVFIFIFNHCNGQGPSSTCSEDQIFRLSDTSCSSFKETCYKDDEQCKKLQDGCKQCPPNNITLTMLRTIWKHLTNSSSSETNNSRKLFESAIQDMLKSKNSYSIPLIILMIILLIMMIIFFLEVRFKLFIRNIQACQNKRNSEYQILHSSKFKYQNDMKEKIESGSKELLEINSKIDSILLEFQNHLLMQSSDIQFATIQFQFSGINQESIELYVHNNHNIVQVKQQICAKLPHAKQDDYKVMKLKYNGDILDDNEYLLKYINSSKAIVHCIIDSTINASDIVVVKLQGKMRVPDIIQINKQIQKDIMKLKEIIGKIINSKDFSVFKQSTNENGSMKMEEMTNDLSLNNLTDGEWIRIITKEQGKLIIKSIFDDDDSITVEYVNTDLISSLTTSVANKNNSDPKNFVLFCNNKYLDEGKYIFEYEISNESPVKFCCFMKWSGITMDEEYVEKGGFSELRHGKYENPNKKILIKKYEVRSPKNWKDEEFMLNALITFQITKCHRRFIQLLGVYNEDTSLYVVMENMAKDTMKIFIKGNDRKLEKNEIYKWSAQILEGLQFLHRNKFIHRDLNPSSILVNDKNDLKLSSFNLSKYLDIYKPSSIMSKIVEKEILPVRYMAPEILSSNKYGVECDVWSFGAVLIRIVSGSHPYSQLEKNEARDKIMRSRTIEYELLTEYSEFKPIIDSCLKSEPNQRETIDKLIKIENIKKYIEN